MTRYFVTAETTCPDCPAGKSEHCSTCHGSGSWRHETELAAALVGLGLGAVLDSLRRYAGCPTPDHERALGASCQAMQRQLPPHAPQPRLPWTSTPATPAPPVSLPTSHLPPPRTCDKCAGKGVVIQPGWEAFYAELREQRPDLVDTDSDSAWREIEQLRQTFSILHGPELRPCPDCRPAKVRRRFQAA